MDIPPNQWIIKLLGYNENELIERIKRGEEIQYNKIHKKVKPGIFQTLTIANLIDVTSMQIGKKNSNSNYPLFSIYVRKTKNDDTYFDTSSLQRIIKSDRPVMFQVASNFNAQENASPMTNLSSGYYLTNLMEDSTQGPSAAAGAGVGAIARWIEHQHNPINLLKGIDSCRLNNGKLVGCDPKGLNIPDIQIGLHQDLTANWDRSQFGKCRFYPNDSPLIDQIYTSTIALNKNTKNENQLKAAELFLKAAYDGTYLSAIYRETKKLVLTMIGGGVFYNPRDLIFDSIANAHVKLTPYSDLEEVILPLYDINTNPQDIVNKLLERGYPNDKISIFYK